MNKQHNDTDIQRQLGYNIRGYEVTSYHCDAPETLLPLDQKMNYSVTLEYSMPSKLDTMVVLVRILVFSDNGETDQKQVISFVGQAVFGLTGVEECLVDDEIVFPDGFIANIANIAVSTSRGVLLMKGAGTVYAKTVMPVINTAEIVPKGSWKIAQLPLPLQ